MKNLEHKNHEDDDDKDSKKKSSVKHKHTYLLHNRKIMNIENVMTTTTHTHGISPEAKFIHI